jgi:murein DD-endopeptidase MepM/ murein hydrolase activator NlpD
VRSVLFPAVAGRVGLVILAVLLAVGLAGIARAESHDLDHQLSDARARATEARAREQALAGDVAAQSEQIDAVESQIGDLRTEVVALEQQLNQARALLGALERELADKTRTLRRARQQLVVAQRHLSQRVVDIYTSDEPDLVSVALGADSLDEMMDVLDMRSRVVEADTDLVGQITGLRQRVIRERARTAGLRTKQAAETAAIERHTSERRSVMTTLVARRDSLTSLRAARERSLAAVQVDRREWEAQADALAAEGSQLASVVVSSPPVADVVPDTTPSSTSSGFVWPVRGSLVSPYGQRWGRLHSGIDIAAPAGTPIVASASGQVVYAGSMSGYGLIVVIQHAGGVATAYAHNSSISVSVGQSVAQGQPIAAVGCTGHCFGDHVHFEVRVGGSAVDPMGYL